MKTFEYYNHFKSLLIQDSKEAKRTTNGKDKAYIRQVINDSLDGYKRELNTLALREEISEKRNEQFKNWLESLACNLHP